MEADSTSFITNNINAPQRDVDKYNVKLVQDLRKQVEQLQAENAELTLENVKTQVKQNIEAHTSAFTNRDEEVKKKNATIKHMKQDIASMTEELETLRRSITAKENRIVLLEEEKRILFDQMEKGAFALKQELHAKEMALYNARIENQQLSKSVCEAQVELSQCRMQQSNFDNQRQMLMNMSKEKEQALMLVGVWQDKCKGQESLNERLQARLRVLAATETDEEN